MNTLKSSSVALAAAAIAGLGFKTSYHLVFTTPVSADEPSTSTMLADKAILVVKKSQDDNVAKYLLVNDIDDDGMSGTLSIIEPGHKLHDLIELDHLKVIGEAVSLGELIAGDFDGAVAMLNFDADVEVSQSKVA